MAFISRPVLFQSTLPVGGATPFSSSNFNRPRNFNPRSPWGERQHLCQSRFPPYVFQSTLPVGGATWMISCRLFFRIYFNPRSPWGERLWVICWGDCIRYFNPRSPWGERPLFQFRICTQGNFNPRSPWGERHWALVILPCMKYFNPRSPWGERHLEPPFRCYIYLTFQSTLPVGGATVAPRRCVYACKDFNPRSPWGERRELPLLCPVPEFISIHAPRGGSDSKDAQFYLRIFGEKVNFECDFSVNSRCQPVS